MKPTIQRASVIGSGVMGSAIAAHLANVGIPCLLLDIVPPGSQSLPAGSPERSDYAIQAIERMKTTKPAPFFDNDSAALITAGNIEDHLNLAGETDWIIEAVIEDASVKKQLYRKIEKVWKPGTIVSSNTSGISIRTMAEECSKEFQSYFLGTHFFNPPRYMHLLEIIPGPLTNRDVVSYITDFCETTLGKGIVTAKDTPNFIANRIGTHSLLAALQEMLENGYTAEELDAVTGPVMGRPNSGTLRTFDLVGIDTFVNVIHTVTNQTTDEYEKRELSIPELLPKMIELGWLGDKKGQGFYKKAGTAEGKQILTLDPSTLAYRPAIKVNSESLEAAKKAKELPDKLKLLIDGDDRCSQLAWNILKRIFLYSANKAGEIAESILDIDNAIKWGYAWELGPFEMWDAVGLTDSVKRMEREGLTVPKWVSDWVDSGHHSFYQREKGVLSYYSNQQYKRDENSTSKISLRSLKEQNRVVLANRKASLIDLEDGIACLEFHSPNNAIDLEMMDMILRSMVEVRRNFRGLVIANEGKNFCVGANLKQILADAKEARWDELDRFIRLFQHTLLQLKHFEKPVVAAPHRMTLGGGVEVCMAADTVTAYAETQYGLVETAVGLIPAGGGCKELVFRIFETLESRVTDDQIPFIKGVFEDLINAKVMANAFEARKNGFLRQRDRVILHRDHLLDNAKQEALRLADEGYHPPVQQKIPAAGTHAKEILSSHALYMREAGMISEYDYVIAQKLAHVLTGGDVPPGIHVTEQHLLDLEREAFLSLCGNPKTQERIEHMLTKGRALRN